MPADNVEFMPRNDLLSFEEITRIARIASELGVHQGRPLSCFFAAVGLVRGTLGVAETGSVLLLEANLQERVVSMLCQRLVQGIPRELIVDSLDDFAGWMQAHAVDSPYATLTTGPSRTADIERELTIGVQGPRELVVVVVG